MQKTNTVNSVRMASERSGSSRESPERRGGGGGSGQVGETAGVLAARAHHPRSFKLRFAAPREPGRSDVSLVKPLGLPATVAGKPHTRAGAGAPDPAAEAAALRRVRDMFACGPTHKYKYPALSSHEYGWWWWAPPPASPWLRHHISDSAWMRERLRLLPPERARR